MFKLNKKIAAVIGIATLSAVCLTGCGGASQSASYKADTDFYAESKSDSYYGYESDYEGYSEAPASGSSANTSYDINQSDRKLIKTVYLDVETLQFEEGCKTVEEYTGRLGGYIENSSTYNDSIYYYNNSYRKNRNANYTLRIPRENLDAFLNSIGNVGNITSQSTSTEDVTLSYLDIEARAKSLDIQQERLLALLEKAETVDEIIALEDRISDVTYQLEAQESILKNYDNLVSFSTVHLNLSEVERVTVAEPETVGERIAAGLDDTFYHIKEGFKDFTVDFVVNLPFIIIWLAVVAILVFIVILLVKAGKKIRAKRIAKKQAKWAAQREAAQRNQPAPVQNTTEQK